jgi:O-antigen/teichoic acid export membrane protein
MSDQSGESSALRGTPSVVARQVVVAIVTVGAGILIARMVTAAEFGVYALIVLLVGFTRIIAEGGLGAALVHQRETPTPHEYRQLFTVQILVATGLTIALSVTFVLVPASAYAVEGWQWACVVASLGALAVPFSSNAVAFLERSLDYTTLGLITAVQPVAFGVLSVAFVALGAGVVGIGLAAALSFGLAGATARLTSSPIGFTRHLRGFAKNFRFGIPFSAAQLISSLKDAVVPLLLGLSLGAAAAGYVSWAQQLAVLPAYFAASFARYLFPVFARIRLNPSRLASGVTVALAAFNCSTAPLAFVLIFWPEAVTESLYGTQWLVAVDSLILLAAANIFAPTNAVLLSLMNAVGRPNVSLLLTVVWFAGTWTLVPLFALQLGMGAMGYAVANLLLQIPTVFLIAMALRVTRFSLWRGAVLPWMIAALSGGAALGASLLTGTRDDFVGIAFAAASLVVTAGVYLWIYAPDLRALARLYKG